MDQAEERCNAIQQIIPYRRVLIKVSGESFLGTKSHGIDFSFLKRIAQEIIDVQTMGLQICLVVGGGNICRGVHMASEGLDRCAADHMGMLATLMNGLALHKMLEKAGASSRLVSGLPAPTICQTYYQSQCVRHLDKGRLVIFAAGTGIPFFTTDTAAALRASEMSCDLIMKATQVDGVYTGDPQKDSNVYRYDTLSYAQVLQDDLQVMDAAAISLARANKIPIAVFSIHKKNSIVDTLNGTGVFTLIGGGE